MRSVVDGVQSMTLGISQISRLHGEDFVEPHKDVPNVRQGARQVVELAVKQTMGS